MEMIQGIIIGWDYALPVGYLNLHKFKMIVLLVEIWKGKKLEIWLYVCDDMGNTEDLIHICTDFHFIKFLFND